MASEERAVKTTGNGCLDFLSYVFAYLAHFLMTSVIVLTVAQAAMEALYTPASLGTGEKMVEIDHQGNIYNLRTYCTGPTTNQNTLAILIEADESLSGYDYSEL